MNCNELVKKDVVTDFTDILIQLIKLAKFN